MVGTAVYQVGLASSISAKNLSALNPGVQKTEPPRESGAERPAISPWMWNKGITLSARSLAESSSVVAMLRAEAQMLAWASGTIFGREVVPEVCRMRATSPGSAGPGLPAAPAAAPDSRNAPAPACGSGASAMTATPSFSAARSAGVSLPASTISAFALRSSR